MAGTVVFNPKGLARLTSAATRRTCGKVSFISSSRFAISSGVNMARPVIFAPGLARFDTIPVETGSPEPASTMGIVRVAFFAAIAPGVVYVTNTSTFSRTSSSASRGTRS